jgi:hypothetical protein
MARLLSIAAIVIALCAGAGGLAMQSSKGTAPYTVIDLHPDSSSGFGGSSATAAAGGWQAGYGRVPNIICCPYALFPYDRALLWKGTAASFINLHPAGSPYRDSQALGTDGFNIVGFNGPHATLWTGAQNTPVDIHPPTFVRSRALGTSGGQHAGFGEVEYYSDRTGRTIRYNHALVWLETAASVEAVDIHPPDYADSQASATSGGQHVGRGAKGTQEFFIDSYHALLWPRLQSDLPGATPIVVDLNPAGFAYSYALSTSGLQHVGSGYSNNDGHIHALLWKSAGDSFETVDLNPTGVTPSFALATNGIYQAGYGLFAGHYHAFVWSGAAASAIDLHQFLPRGFSDSEAHGIDESNNIVGQATTDDGFVHAILWKWNGCDCAPPSAPQNLSAMTSAKKGVSLSWSPPQSAGTSPIAGYRIYRMAYNQTQYTLLTMVGNVTSYEDRATKHGALYSYYVTAVNSAGQSAPSNDASAVAN